ncbi:FecR family protein [Chitinophaga sp.]|uniref:FecR family protein n=1 Tax=Chitinophaga sp. TaxID=1869181 RepID=UPI002F944F35
MDDDLLHDLLEKYQQGKLTAAEKAQLDAWYDRFDTTHAGMQPFANPEAEQAAAQRLQARIESSLEAAGHTNGRVVPLYRRWLYGAAAAIILLLLSFPLYRWLLKRNTVATAPAMAWQNIVTPSGKMTKLTLADGSQVWLNANSSMRYPVAFSATNREIWLTDGEAFFDVSPDKQRPFIVHTDKLNVQVLGTSFNIRAYAQLDKVSIGVATGKVQVVRDAQPLGILTENKQLNWNRNTQKASILESDAAQMGNWKEGLIRLDGASFTELAIMIKNVYGYQLSTRNKVVQQASFTATFKNTNKIEDVMKMICRTQQVKYQRQDSTITLY